jgi:hypothetical protein
MAGTDWELFACDPEIGRRVAAQRDPSWPSY